MYLRCLSEEEDHHYTEVVTNSAAKLAKEKFGDNCIFESLEEPVKYEFLKTAAQSCGFSGMYKSCLGFFSFLVKRFEDDKVVKVASRLIDILLHGSERICEKLVIRIERILLLFEVVFEYKT